MSRALDPDSIASLRAGAESVTVYTDIASLLCPRDYQDHLLEIELLGKSHTLGPGQNYLRDGNAVAIPKMRLVQAFFVALKMLKRDSPPSHVFCEHQDTEQATAVVLLMDPEHLTAANCRKRSLLAAIQADMSAGGRVKGLLDRERYFVDSLLTSFLHRHTKSPTLWSHRRWLMQQYVMANIPIDISHTLRAVVLVAAEKHPRNYYAWCHARWLVESLQLPSTAAPQESESQQVCKDVKSWCFGHHDDISGWSFLLHALTLDAKCSQYGKSEQQHLGDDIFAQTQQVAKSCGWHNESVLWFLRAMKTRTTPNSLETNPYPAPDRPPVT